MNWPTWRLIGFHLKSVLRLTGVVLPDEPKTHHLKANASELPQQDSRRKKRRQNNLPVSLNLPEFSDSLLRAVESTMDRRAAIFLTTRVEEPLELMGVSQISILPTDMFASCRWNASILKTPRPNTVHGTRRTNSETRESRKSWELCGLLNPDPKIYVLHLQIDSFGRIMAARKHTIFCLLSILWAILLRGLKVVTAPSWLVRCALLPQEKPCSASLQGYNLFWYLDLVFMSSYMNTIDLLLWGPNESLFSLMSSAVWLRLQLHKAILEPVNDEQLENGTALSKVWCYHGFSYISCRFHRFFKNTWNSTHYQELIVDFLAEPTSSAFPSEIWCFRVICYYEASVERG